MARMTESELVTILERRIRQAMNTDDGEVSEIRQEIFSAYYRQPYKGDSDLEDRSKYISGEVLEQVEWAQPLLVRTFMGTDTVVSFEATDEQDEELAKQETDIVNYKVMRANGGRGYLELLKFIKDAVMYPTAYMKVFIDEEEEEIEGWQEMTLGEVEAFRSQEGMEVLGYDETTRIIPSPEEEQPPTTVPILNLHFRLTRSTRTLKLMAIPGEEILVDPKVATTDLDETAFVAHKVTKTRTELLDMGYDGDMLDEVGSSDEGEKKYDLEDTNRRHTEDEIRYRSEEEAIDNSMREFDVYECYADVDWDNDGRAEERRIVLIGDMVFENEVRDYMPLVAMSAVIIPHRHIGMGLGEMVQEQQHLSTTLIRQLMDNIYRLNTGRKFISDDALLDDGSTWDAMQDRVAEFIPVRGSAHQVISHDTTPPFIDQILPVLQYLIESIPMRTGVAPEQNLDPRTVQESTLGAFLGAMEKAGERQELVARNMAETGFKQIFSKAHFLIRKYPDIVTTVKLRGKWITPDPREWRDRTDMKVNVGIGFNNRRAMVGMLMQQYTLQKEAMEFNLVDARHLYHTLSKIVEEGGTGSPEQVYIDPDSKEYQAPQPQPDPQVLLAEKQIEMHSQLGMMDLQRKQLEHEWQKQFEGMKAQLEALKADKEFELRSREAERKEDADAVEAWRDVADIRQEDAKLALDGKKLLVESEERKEAARAAGEISK